MVDLNTNAGSGNLVENTLQSCGNKYFTAQTKRDFAHNETAAHTASLLFKWLFYNTIIGANKYISKQSANVFHVLKWYLCLI